MQPDKRFSIKENEEFDPSSFSFADDDVQTIKEQTASVSRILRAEIIVSFMKYHSLKTEWLTVNPELTSLVSTGRLRTENFEALFEACRNQATFSNKLETYLKNSFSE